MRIDRVFQKQILESLAATFPARLGHDEVFELFPEQTATLYPNLFYLHEHGLVFLRGSSSIGDDEDPHIIEARITAKGMDFLADDGGLSAILGVVTVKLHDETIQALLASKVEASDLPPEQKQTLISQIRELRGEAAKHLVTKIIDYGITKGPDAMHWLSEALQKAAS